jgi:PAS domain S-box-containing protein
MPQVLFLGDKDPLTRSRRILLKRAGYKVSVVHEAEEALDHQSWLGCTLVILDRTVSFDHRREIITKLEALKIGVLDLTAPERFKRDGRGLSDHGPESFLELVGRAVMASHGHPEIQGRNVAWVDRDRRFVHVTEGFLELIGYDRDEVLGHLIDDFTYPGTANAREVFHRYLKDGHMEGAYVLRHKSGQKVAIEYEAGILADGCMYSNMRRANRELQNPPVKRRRA